MHDPDAPLRPVFYDESRRRWSWVVRLGLAGLFLLSVALTCFLVSVLALPLLPHKVLPKAKEARDFGDLEPVLTARNRAIRRFAQRRDKRKLEELKKENQAKLAARAAQNARV